MTRAIPLYSLWYRHVAQSGVIPGYLMINDVVHILSPLFMPDYQLCDINAGYGRREVCRLTVVHIPHIPALRTISPSRAERGTRPERCFSFPERHRRRAMMCTPSLVLSLFSHLWEGYFSSFSPLFSESGTYEPSTLTTLSRKAGLKAQGEP